MQSTSIIVLKKQYNPKMQFVSFMLFKCRIYSSVKYMDWANQNKFLLCLLIGSREPINIYIHFVEKTSLNIVPNISF